MEALKVRLSLYVRLNAIQNNPSLYDSSCIGTAWQDHALGDALAFCGLCALGCSGHWQRLGLLLTVGSCYDWACVAGSSGLWLRLGLLLDLAVALCSGLHQGFLLDLCMSDAGAWLDLGCGFLDLQSGLLALGFGYAWASLLLALGSGQWYGLAGSVLWVTFWLPAGSALWQRCLGLLAGSGLWLRSWALGVS